MGKIFLYTGDGGGKTTNALGAALRSLGHGKKVVMIQFLKWYKNTGECLFKHPNFTIKQFGREGWKSRNELEEEDRIKATVGLMVAGTYLYRNDPPDLLILDELNLALSLNMVNMEMIKTLLKHIPEKTTVFITGREAPKELMKMADYVIEIKPIKIPKNCDNIEGINY